MVSSTKGPADAGRDGRSQQGVPTPIRIAGALTALEGAIAVVVTLLLVLREMGGHEDEVASGYGTAAWFGIIGGGVLLGGLGLLSGRRWGRAISVVAQILLLPVAYALLTDSHLPIFGVPLAIVALTTLVLLFSPASLHWLADDLPDDTPAGSRPEQRVKNSRSAQGKGREAHRQRQRQRSQRRKD